jgi:hypothetical protein
VWPGQTIQALNWSGGCNGTTITPSIQNGNNITASNYYIVSNVTGGTPPYTLEETSVPKILTIPPSGSGISVCNFSPTGGVNFGQIVGNSQSNFNGTSVITFTLTDSSTPKFIRFLTITI